jgi:hypothetical protein
VGQCVQVAGGRTPEDHDQGVLGHGCELADRADPEAVDRLRRRRTHAPHPLDRQRVQERALTVGRDDEQPVGLGEELRPGHPDRDREAHPLADVAAQPCRDRLGRTGGPAQPPDVRNASSTESPSTRGVVSRKTAKTAALAAAYADIRGGTTTTASGQHRSACPPLIAVRTPQARAS